LKKAIAAQSKPFVTQMLLEAKKLGLPADYWPYLFWSLVEQKKNWPDMPRDQEWALNIGRDIMKRQGDTPAYGRNYEIPTTFDDEKKVNEVLRRMALWCNGTMASNILSGYLDALKSKQRAITKVRDDIPKGMEYTYLKAAFEVSLRDTPALFDDGVFLERVVRRLLK